MDILNFETQSPKYYLRHVEETLNLTSQFFSDYKACQHNFLNLFFEESVLISTSEINLNKELVALHFSKLKIT